MVKNKSLIIRLDEKMKKAMAEAARRKGLPLSSWARMQLIAAVEADKAAQAKEAE